MPAPSKAEWQKKAQSLQLGNEGLHQRPIRARPKR